MNCKICNKEFDIIKKLARHIKDTHKMTTQEYYDKFLLVNHENICPICGKSNRYINLSKGYHKTCSHSCHTKLQNKSYTNNEQEIINNKRKHAWSNKNLDEYKKLQSKLQIEEKALNQKDKYIQMLINKKNNIIKPNYIFY